MKVNAQWNSPSQTERMLADNILLSFGISTRQMKSNCSCFSFFFFLVLFGLFYFFSSFFFFFSSFCFFFDIIFNDNLPCICIPSNVWLFFNALDKDVCTLDVCKRQYDKSKWVNPLQRINACARTSYCSENEIVK